MGIFSKHSQLRPERVQTTCDSPGGDLLGYCRNDLLTVLDKRPAGGREGCWKCTLDGGQSGLVLAEHTSPVTEPAASPANIRRSAKMARKEPSRKSSRASRRLDATMIGTPQQDLRHMGHIGYDGAVFGDISFIGNNYDKLPVKVSSPAKLNGTSGGSGGGGGAGEATGSSHLSLSQHSNTASSLSAISLSSHDDTLTDVSSMGLGGSQSSLGTDTQAAPALDDFDNFDNFTVPDLSSDLDFGSCSLMDDIMKSLSAMKDDDQSDDTLLDTTPSFPTDTTSSLLQDSADSLPRDASLTPRQTSPLTLDSNDHASPISNDISAFGQETSSFGLDSSFGQDFASFRREASPAREEASPIRETYDRSPVYEQSGYTRSPVVTPETHDRSSSYDRSPVAGQNGYDRGENGSLADSASSLTSHGADSKTSLSDEHSPMSSQARIEKHEEDEEDEAEDESTVGAVRSMSASEERQLDEAIELANEFASLSTRPPSSPPTRQKSNRKSSPERKSFTEEMAKSAAVGEELSPEAQEAYNMLVVKGAKERRPRHARNNNANIRAPQGIPGRGESTGNPLRRLRDSAAAPNLHANLPFFDKLKEQTADEDEDEDEGISRPAPPPRTPLRASTVNVKPRQRKHPLDLTGYGSNHKSKTTDKKPDISAPILSTDLSSDDSAFNTESDSASSGSRPRPKSSDSFHSYCPAVTPPASSGYSIKGVLAGAKELGLGQTGDSFWTSKLELPAAAQEESRYSYEDMLESALDGELGQEEEENAPFGVERGDDDVRESREVRVMRSALSPEVSVEDMMYALEETGWQAEAAVKLIKLKQLLSLQLASPDACKTTLISHDWDVARAASALSATAPPAASPRHGRDSPELVHV